MAKRMLKMLVGKKIVNVWLDDDNYLWMQFDDNTAAFISRDPEDNGPGTLHHQSATNAPLHVLGGR